MFLWDIKINKAFCVTRKRKKRVAVLELQKLLKACETLCIVLDDDKAIKRLIVS